MSGLVVVTQGAGFLGQWCVVEAIRRGLQVRAVARTPDEVTAIMQAAVGHVGVEGVLETIVVDPTVDGGWAAALHGARFVLHTGLEPAPPESVTGINQAIVATLLDAARVAGVERVVLTSTVGAALPADDVMQADEQVWTDPTTTVDGAVEAMVERAAVEHAERLGTELVTLLPGIMLGPPVGGGHLEALAVVGDLVLGKVGDVPRRAVEIADVRDVAVAHVNALLSPGTTGRYLLAGESYWMIEVARVLRHRLGNRARSVPTTELSGWKKAVLGWLTPSGSRPPAGTAAKLVHSSERARRDLDWAPRNIDDTLVETAEFILAAERTPSGNRARR